MDYIRDYGQDKELAKQFLMTDKYAQLITKLANRDERLMVVELADLEKFNHELAKNVTANTMRYLQIFYEAYDELVPTFKTNENPEKDVMDVFIEQRMFIAERNKQGRGQNVPGERSQNLGGAREQVVDIDGMHPPDLIRRGEIAFKPASLQATPIREVRAEHIGKLVTVRGIVTRTSDVKPKLTIATYTCDQCSNESFQLTSGSEYTPLFECSSAQCKASKTLGKLTFQHRGSKFVKFQEIKLQEHSDQVPVGHIPRAATILAHGEQARRCAPGDHISVSGVFMTVERASFRMRTGGLAADTYIESHYITQMNKTEDDELDNEAMSLEEAVELHNKHQPFLQYLSRSIAPEIYGHEDLKIALLLLLVGGVDRSPDGMRVRGNINICLMGDPGVAKSQLLGFIDRLAPRSQYTTGRGSSGVGLTAAVLKDPITNELSLEGGALVLADQGICCIDEFDKMMDADRTAIHEVMEQQTVSIAKAGIMTTLNARTSILAAANPAYGRYNRDRSVQDNLQLPPALLSRFDLLWLITDEPNSKKDVDLAEHITNIHTNPLAQQDFGDVLSMKDMRRFFALCKTKEPVVPEELSDKLVSIYLKIRSLRRLKGKSVDSLFTSPRSLLAIVRLSTALARLRLDDVVQEADIDEAYRLYNCSRETLESREGGVTRSCQYITKLMTDIAQGSCACKMSDLKMRVLEDGQVPEEELERALATLEQIDAISIEGDEIILT